MTDQPQDYAVAAFTEEDFVSFSSADRERVLRIVDRAIVRLRAEVEKRDRVVEAARLMSPAPSYQALDELNAALAAMDGGG